MKSFEEKGFWWLPESTENRVAGLLTFSDLDGGQLELLGYFISPATGQKLLHRGMWRVFPIILGQSISGKKYTLVRCFETNIKIEGEYGTNSYQTSLVIEGWHFQSLEEIEFHRFLLSYSGLTEWYEQGGISTNFEEETIKSIEFNELPPVVIPIEKGELRFLLNGKYESSFPFGFITRIGFSQQAMIEVEFQELHSFKECLNWERKVSDFLTFAIGSPTPLVTFSGINKKCLSSNLGEPLPLTLFLQKSDSDKVQSNVFSHEMKFTFPQIASDPQSVLEGWFDAFKELRPVIALYMDLLYRSSRLVRHRFQDALAALYGWYAVRIAQKDKHQSESFQIPSRPDWEKCFAETLEHFGPMVGDTFGAHKDFVERVVSAKYGLDSGKYPPLTDQPDWIELAILTEQLKALVELCLLREIRFSEESQKQWFESIAAKIPKREQFAGWEF